MIIKIVTISLMAVFYICYFAKMISQKKQGIKTDQLGKGKEGFVKFIEVALKIITYLLPVIQIISIVFYSGTAHIVLQFTGVVITMFGVLAFLKLFVLFYRINIFHNKLQFLFTIGSCKKKKRPVW